MSKTKNTKLHQLLSGVSAWTSDLRSNVEDYLAANCTVQEVERLCALTGHEDVIPRIGRSDKLDLLFILLPRLTPEALLTAWNTVLVERADRKEQRAAERAESEKPRTDDILATVLRLLSPSEIAALYYGHVQILHDTQALQFSTKSPRDIASRIHSAHLHRMRLDGGLDWLAIDDPDKAKVVAIHLADLPNTQAQQMAQWITTRVKQQTSDNED